MSQLQTQAGLGRTLAGDSVPRAASRSQNLPRMCPPVEPACTPEELGFPFQTFLHQAGNADQGHSAEPRAQA